MKSSEEMDLPPEARHDLALLREHGGGGYDVEAGLRAFEARIAEPAPSSRLPRVVLLSALALIGAASVTAVVVSRRAPPPPTVIAAPVAIASSASAAPDVAPAPAPTLTSVSIDTLPTVATSTARPTSPVSAPPSVSAPALDAPDLVDAEVRQAATVRAAAKSDPAHALALAAEGDREFPKGLLHAEREAIAIEALARLGRASEAASRGEAFANAYPSHPRTGRIRAIVNGERPWEQ